MRIVIVGLGVIGGSFAISLKKAGYHDVYGIDTDPATIEKAKSAGIIVDGNASGEAFLRQADLTVISLYPRLIKGFLEKNRENFKPGSIITDATGIKMNLLREIEGIIPETVDFIFGHPMAGREKKGIDYASAEVFRNANYIITPTEKNRPENIEILKKIISDMGFGHICAVTPEEHDELIGFTSQLPHAMAVALINSDKEGRNTGLFIGDSYRDLTRIANINEDLWSELFLGNKENLLMAINNFEIELDLIKKAVFENDRETLCRFFRKSSSRREKL